MKKLLIVLLVLAVLAGAAVFVLLGSIGGIVKGVVERVGTDATQAPVTLETVDFSVTEGRGELRNLVVGNPEGFDSEHSMRFGIVRVVVDKASLGSDPIVIKEVVVDSPSVIYEIGTGRTNIGTIQDNVEAFARRLGAGGGGGTTEEPGADEGGGRRVVIEDLYIRNVQVKVAATLLGGRGAGTTIREIHLEDVGKDDGGASPAEVAAAFLDALLDGVIDAVAGLDLGGLKEAGEGIIEDAGKTLKGLFGGDDE